eukprot:CAMPEP_0201670170 /NCGR_PEP_ID=MMETSP0494-20130426/25982_1 /ASSEMBLY_ACC=CAM_ASM_000839 /TAXON_ID=420259 /ORGANISM="Thalassiosira gravida, Strain GMp14c1" /LENGTH=174 /DNA_ID=CAMNT_0048151143 /DNA_START=88 /DNA_END=609 /DNA_ORIENTATION=+
MINICSHFHVRLFLLLPLCCDSSSFASLLFPSGGSTTSTSSSLTGDNLVFDRVTGDERCSFVGFSSAFIVDVSLSAAASSSSFFSGDIDCDGSPILVWASGRDSSTASPSGAVGALSSSPGTVGAGCLGGDTDDDDSCALVWEAVSSGTGGLCCVNGREESASCGGGGWEEVAP